MVSKLSGLLAFGLVALGGVTILDPGTSASAEAAQVPKVESRSSSDVSSDPLPTVQIDSGLVWAQTIIGNTVYAGGQFSQTRPAGAAAGQQLTPRDNLLAYDIRTGELIPGFAPKINGPVKALAASPDGKRIYVGGTFTRVNGVATHNFTALDASTGQIIAKFNVPVGGSYVNAIVASNTTVYLGGLFSGVKGQGRKNLAAVKTDGALLPWAPATERQVDALALSKTGSKVIAGGRFNTVNGATQRSVVALDPSTGKRVDWAADKLIYNANPQGKSGISSLVNIGDQIVGTGWMNGGGKGAGNLEGMFAADGETGKFNWVMDCKGDAYSALGIGDTAYVASHTNDCSTLNGYPRNRKYLRHTLAFTATAKGVAGRTADDNYYPQWEGTPAPALKYWAPVWTTGTASGQGQAVWSLTGNADYVAAGGEFPVVNGKAQYGLVRFAKPSLAPKKDGPRLKNAQWPLKAAETSPGKLAFTLWRNWDRDDLELTYAIRRADSPTPLASKIERSPFWEESKTLTLELTAPGGTAKYLATATDPDGNVAYSTIIEVTSTAAKAAPGQPR